jgi:hypothetical protein
MKSKGVVDQTCVKCGGLHFGSFGCPYEETTCDVCHKTLLEHPGLAFCEGGKAEHNPSQKYCTDEWRKIVAQSSPQQEIQALRDGRRVLVGALREYGDHHRDCPQYRMSITEPCNCGFGTILSRYPEETKR